MAMTAPPRAVVARIRRRAPDTRVAERHAASRHCQCAQALTDVLVGAAQKHKQLKSLETLLRANRGRALASCPGTELPAIHWEALVPKLCDLMLRNLSKIDPEDFEKSLEEASEKTAKSMVRVVRNMWDVTLRAKTPEGARVVH